MAWSPWISRVIFMVASAVLAYNIWLKVVEFVHEELEGRRIIVTGGSSGIGEQIAYHYCSFGASVFIVARREELLKQVVKKCKTLAPVPEKIKVAYMVASLNADPKTAHDVIEKAIVELGGIDYLILNHYYPGSVKAWEASEESFHQLQESIDVNFLAYTNLAAYGLPYLKESGGAISVVSSESGKFTAPYVSHYTAAKFALDGFFSSLRQEVTSQNVSVTLNVLGIIGTPQMLTLLSILDNIDPADAKEHYKGYVPTPAETALEIVEATTTRQRELYYPSTQWIMTKVYLRHFLPETLDRKNTELFTRIGKLVGIG